MSNGRLFCLTWAIASGVIGILSIFGVEGRHHGVPGMVADVILGVSMASATVGFFGDRDRRKA